MNKLPRPSRAVIQKPRQPSKKLRKRVLFRYEPELDMTVWELARFVAILMEAKPMHFERFFTLIPPHLRRHFRYTKHG